MIYPFICDCGNYIEDIRLAKDCSLPQVCDKCGKVMARVYSTPCVFVSNYGYYDSGLGKYIKSKSDIKDAMTKYKDTTGSELVDVGNEKPTNIKKKDMTYNFTKSETEGISNTLSSF